MQNYQNKKCQNFFRFILLGSVTAESFNFNFQQVSPEEVIRRCTSKQMFLKISQNIQENACARVSFLIKFQASGLQLY